MIVLQFGLADVPATDGMAGTMLEGACAPARRQDQQGHGPHPKVASSVLQEPSAGEPEGRSPSIGEPSAGEREGKPLA